MCVAIVDLPLPTESLPPMIKYAEIRVKMKNERGDLDKLRKDLDAYIENNPIIVSTKKSSFSFCEVY